jgi:ketosteroid isomerase-like protein
MAEDAAERSSLEEGDDPRVEVVRSVVEVLKPEDPDPEYPYELARHRESLYRERMGPLLDPAIETVIVAELPAGMKNRYEGVEGWWDFWLSWLEEWEDYRFSIDGVEVHGDHVVFDVHIVTRGRISGVPVAADLTHVWSVEGGNVRLVRIFVSRRRALAAVAEDGGA